MKARATTRKRFLQVLVSRIIYCPLTYKVGNCRSAKRVGSLQAQLACDAVDRPVKSQCSGTHCDTLRNKPRPRMSPESPSGWPGFICSSVLHRRLGPSRSARPRTISPFLPLVTRRIAVLPVAMPSTVPSPPSFSLPHPTVAIECAPVTLSPIWASLKLAMPHSAPARRSARVRRSIFHSPVKGCSADAEPNTSKQPHTMLRNARVVICDLTLS